VLHSSKNIDRQDHFIEFGEKQCANIDAAPLLEPQYGEVHPLDLAMGVIARGWTPVPIPIGKSPKLKKWQKLKIDTHERARKYFYSVKLNVGVQMGLVSGGLTDVDLDCNEAIILAQYFLPHTDAVYGRASKRRSHHLYTCDDPEPKAAIKWFDNNKKVIVELRLGGGGKGAQSVAPGSMHPSGELYEWDKHGEPAKAVCKDLKMAVGKLAVACLLIRHWPQKGALHDCALGVGGFLARAGWNPNDVEHFIYSICRSLRDVQEPKKHALTARDSVESFAKGAQVYGLPWLQEFFGKDVANTIAKYVGYNEDVRVEAAKHSEQGKAGVSLADFYAFMPQHAYIYAPTREMWPAGSVNSRLGTVKVGDDEIPASLWLDINRPVEQMSWAPGLPMAIRHRLISEGGWIKRDDVSCFNLYRGPTIELGDASKATPWIELVHKVFPADADHLIKWFAHRRQRPQEKINHGLVLGSQHQGVGKDTILEGVKRAVGAWNFKEVLPAEMFETFNPFVRCVVLRISEAKDMGDVSRFDFYEHTKSYLAAPPDVLPCNDKYIRKHYVLNCMGVVITTNHLTDGIFLPAEDRRHFVAWSNITKEDFEPGYWIELYRWYDNGGDQHVAAYLDTLDLSDFDPKAPPAKTPAFWSIVNANRTTEEGELADILDALGIPAVVTLIEIHAKASLDFGDWLADRKNRKAVAHRLETCGYRALNNPDADDGLWRINNRRQMVYAQVKLPLRDQLTAAQALRRRMEAEKARQAAEQANPQPKRQMKISQ
jgi:Bifunctional DNA primase/polymerase, N-terminal